MSASERMAHWSRCAHTEARVAARWTSDLGRSEVGFSTSARASRVRRSGAGISHRMASGQRRVARRRLVEHRLWTVVSVEPAVHGAGRGRLRRGYAPVGGRRGRRRRMHHSRGRRMRSVRRLRGTQLGLAGPYAVLAHRLRIRQGGAGRAAANGDTPSKACGGSGCSGGLDACRTCDFLGELAYFQPATRLSGDPVSARHAGCWESRQLTCSHAEPIHHETAVSGTHR
jgi:hypothetical protein